MGLNLNLCQMIGAPEKATCPNCQKIVPASFEDYDIECGNPTRKWGNGN